jgi:hypothetical protein
MRLPPWACRNKEFLHYICERLRVQEFWWGASRTHRKRTFVADSPDSGLVYPHKVGLPSHICNGNFGESTIPLRGRRESRTCVF